MKDIIAICVSRLHMWEQEKHVRSLCESARAEGYDVIIYNISTKLDVETNHGNGEVSVFELIPYETIAALIVLAESFRNDEVCKKLADRAKKEHVPVIAIDHYISGCYNLSLAYASSFEQIVRHVVEYHGCREINFMAGFENNEFSDDRIAIFRQVMEEKGLPFSDDYLEYGQFWEGPSTEIAEKWVSQWESGEQRRPEAIICANDIMAITVSNILQNHGIKVPEDIIITGFDGLEIGQCCTPKLTTARDITPQVGFHTMKMISEYISGERREPYDVEIPFRVIYNESCGCETIQWRNLSEEIMHWQKESGAIRNMSNDMFMMMQLLSDGYSPKQMAKKLQSYWWVIPSEDMVMCVNENFYRNTDIDTDETGNDLILLAQMKDGVYSVPCTRIEVGTEIETCSWLNEKTGQAVVVPLHWQTERYGFMAFSHNAEKINYDALYQFSLSMDQVFGSVRKQSQLYALNVRDPLTSLYNRRGFYEELENRMTLLADKEKTLFLASVDMDRLKYINDHYGHAEGDYAICSIGDLLRDTVQGKDGICARFGGDEYMVGILVEAENADTQFFKEYKFLLESFLEERNSQSGKPYEMGVSCGVVSRNIEAVQDIEKLMNEADAAMYAVKEIHHQENPLSRE